MLKKVSIYLLAVIGLFLFLLTVSAAEGGNPIYLITTPLMLIVAVILSRYDPDNL